MNRFIERCGEDEPRFPPGLRDARGLSPAIAAVGNMEILREPKLALFCSVKCPGNLILQTYDLALALRDAGVTVIGGFHTPMEQECLRLLLRGKQSLIICPARSIDGMRLPAEWREPLDQGRLLLLSPFDRKQRRTTAETAERRNELVGSIADAVLVPYAAPGSRTEARCRVLLSNGKTTFTLESPYNGDLLALGARSVQPETVEERLRSAGFFQRA